MTRSEIAKDIIVAMIQNNLIRPEHYQGVETPAEAVAKAYETIMKTLNEY